MNGSNQGANIPARGPRGPVKQKPRRKIANPEDTSRHSMEYNNVSTVTNGGTRTNAVFHDGSNIHHSGVQPSNQNTQSTQSTHNSATYPADGCTLYIGNLPYETSDFDLRSLFTGFDVQDVTLPTNPRTTRPVGVAFVSLDSASEAQQATMSLDGSMFKERKISVQVAQNDEAAIKRDNVTKRDANGRFELNSEETRLHRVADVVRNIESGVNGFDGQRSAEINRIQRTSYKEGCCRLLIGNLASGVSKFDISKLFPNRKIGSVTIKGNNSKANPRHSFVVIPADSESEAHEIVDRLSRTVLRGKQLNVQLVGPGSRIDRDGDALKLMAAELQQENQALAAGNLLAEEALSNKRKRGTDRNGTVTSKTASEGESFENPIYIENGPTPAADDHRHVKRVKGSDLHYQQLPERPTPPPMAGSYNYYDYGAMARAASYDDAASHGPNKLDVRLSELSNKDQSLQERYFNIHKPDAIVRCLSCSEEGHMEESCPSRTCQHCGARDDHFGPACPLFRRCSRCRQRGHDSQRCTRPVSSAISATEPCDICGRLGHIEEECHDLWLTFKPEMKDIKKVHPSLMRVNCYNCGGQAHWGDDCTGLPALLRRASDAGNPSPWSAAHANKFIEGGVDVQMVRNTRSAGRGSYQLAMLDDVRD